MESKELCFAEKLKEVDSELKVVVERREEDAGFCIKTEDDDSSAVKVNNSRYRVECVEFCR